MSDIAASMERRMVRVIAVLATTVERRTAITKSLIGLRVLVTSDEEETAVTYSAGDHAADDIVIRLCKNSGSSVEEVLTLPRSVRGVITYDSFGVELLHVSDTHYGLPKYTAIMACPVTIQKEGFFLDHADVVIADGFDETSVIAALKMHGFSSPAGVRSCVLLTTQKGPIHPHEANSGVGNVLPGGTLVLTDGSFVPWYRLKYPDILVTFADVAHLKVMARS